MSPSFNKYFLFSFDSDCIFCLVEVLSVVQVSNIRDKDGRVKHLAVWLLALGLYQYGYYWCCFFTELYWHSRPGFKLFGVAIISMIINIFTDYQSHIEWKVQVIRTLENYPVVIVREDKGWAFQFTCSS